MRRFVEITDPGDDSLPSTGYEEVTAPPRVVWAIVDQRGSHMKVITIAESEDAAWERFDDEHRWLTTDPRLRLSCEQIEIIASVSTWSA